MRILLVEDNAILSHHIISQLNESGHVVVHEINGSSALQTIRKQEFDIAIIDIGLPDFDGIRLIKQIRNQGIHFPVIILTARSSWQDKVKGLEAGADDYLVKPFHMEELVARLYTLIRRSSGFSSSELNVGSITLNLHEQSVAVNKKKLELTTTEYQILKCLLRHHDKVISKGQLADHIYESHEHSENQLNLIEVMVSRLRKKLKDHGQSKVISTIRGRGYCLTSE